MHIVSPSSEISMLSEVPTLHILFASLGFVICDEGYLDFFSQELEAEHREKKSHYDTTAAGLESNRSKLEQVLQHRVTQYCLSGCSKISNFMKK